MSGEKIARDYLRSARERLASVHRLFERGAYPDVVREAQEILELVLKGLFRWAGADPPRVHDPAPALEPLLGRLLWV